jgi:hypothetical protein
VRATFEHIQTTTRLSWKMHIRRERQFGFGWHFHREFELTLITEGTGTRFVGDCVEEYGPGDLALIGSELPHTYASSPGSDGQEAIVIQFHRDFLGQDFFERPEFTDVARMLDRAARGLSFPAGLGQRAARLRELGALPPAARTLTLLDTLVQLACSDAGRPLAGEGHVPILDADARDRIDAVVRLLHAKYAGPISLERAARAAHMTPVALSSAGSSGAAPARHSPDISAHCGSTPPAVSCATPTGALPTLPPSVGITTCPTSIAGSGSTRVCLRASTANCS